MASSTVTAIFAAADNHLNNVLLGEEVTYTPADGSTVSIFDMRIDREINQGLNSSDKGWNVGPNDVMSVHGIGLILVSDIACPVYPDKITATGPGGETEEWTVLFIMASDSATHTVALRNDLRPSIGI